MDEKIEAGNTIHTYDQMSTYVENSDPISVATCYCRHEAALLDENDTCGKSNEVCMQFGVGARFIIDKGLGREISKKEAMEILKKSEQEGLVHCSTNQQNIDFVCNCCADHCIILMTALAQPKPGLALNSGFEPKIDHEGCITCDVCIENCPSRRWPCPRTTFSPWIWTDVSAAASARRVARRKPSPWSRRPDIPNPR